MPAATLPLIGKRVLITGAGGSIGSALTHAIAKCSPALLILLDSSENALYQLGLTLTTPHIAILGSVGDALLLDDLFSRHHIEIIFHTAAYKHVPMLEFNPFAALANNVFGTRTLLAAATRYATLHFVLVSTDKAVDPQSILGASKRLAELLLLAHTAAAPAATAVRLCNVWGTQGSVVERFLAQIAAGGPLTLTEPAATRFFISLEQAVAAILAGLEPRPAGVILIPQVEAAIPILELAQSLLRSQHQSAARDHHHPPPPRRQTPRVTALPPRASPPRPRCPGATGIEPRAPPRAA